MNWSPPFRISAAFPRNENSRALRRNRSNTWRRRTGLSRDAALRELHDLKQFHLRESGMERTVDDHFQELAELVRGLAVLGELSPRAVDAISSFGERLSSLIVVNHFEKHGLKAVHLDARK